MDMTGNTVTSFDRSALHAGVSARLKAMIIEGELPPGARLNERVLSEKLDVSRTPLREAFKMLAGIGLVELLPNRGAVVARLEPEQVELLLHHLFAAWLVHLLDNLERKLHVRYGIALAIPHKLNVALITKQDEAVLLRQWLALLQQGSDVADFVWREFACHLPALMPAATAFSLRPATSHNDFSVCDAQIGHVRMLLQIS